MNIRKPLIVLGAVMAFIGGAAAPADAHQGNWTQQYQETYRWALANCRAYSNGPCDLQHVQYRTSGEISEHSRRFVWNAYGVGCSVAMYFDIGHTNSVFYANVWDDC